MKAFWRYLFPALFGLLIYISIRLVTDVPSTEQFWDRPWINSIVEVSFSMMAAYIIDALLRRTIKNFSLTNESFNARQVFKEFGFVLLLSILFINPVILLIHYLISDPIDWADVTIANIIVGLYVLLYYAIVRGNIFIHSYIEQKTQIERLKNDQLETELKFLKAQYHPHFLFNALNTIYFQMDEDIPAAKKTDQQQLVPVQQELDHLQNFIHLQKQRSSGKLQLSYCFDETLTHQKIYPLLLLPLVENAFKYVGGSYNMNIEAKNDTGGLLFKVHNSLATTQAQKIGGIGLENLQRRLHLLYPGKHEFSILSTDKDYTAVLKLQTV